MRAVGPVTKVELTQEQKAGYLSQTENNWTEDWKIADSGEWLDADGNKTGYWRHSEPSGTDITTSTGPVDIDVRDLFKK